ncbi:Methyltransferase type 11, partial [mine drainage metagenome]
MRSGIFGRDPEAYHRARLPYPERVYQVLIRRCGLRPGTATFEIGPGTGIATRELLQRGASPLTLIEPDRRLVRFLRANLRYRPGAVTFHPHRFEEVPLRPGSFDLGVAATSFHWLPERRGLRKVARALRPGGWWAAWGNEHGDPF